MSSKPIILCTDQLKYQGELSGKLAVNFDNINLCQLAQLERLMVKEPEATIVVSWQQPCAELNMIIDFAEKRGNPLLILLRQLNANDINRLPERTGYVLVPFDSSFSLQAWIGYADIARKQQAQMQQEVTQLTDKLAERKQVEKAKGLLMKIHQLDEETAFKAMRNSAMQNSQSLGQIARNLITTLEAVG